MSDAATAPTAAIFSLGCTLDAAVRAASEPQPSSRITAAASSMRTAWRWAPR